MKKRVLLIGIIVVIVILVVLFFPIVREANDGGTVEYSALMYKVIDWNKLRLTGETKTGVEVYWFPNNFHSLDYYDDVLPPTAVVYVEAPDETRVVLCNTGTYNWTEVREGTSMSAIGDAVSPTEMQYSETMQVSENEKMIIDGVSNLKNITIYDANTKAELSTGISYNESENSMSVLGVEQGEYIIEFEIQNEQGSVKYSFKIQKI